MAATADAAATLAAIYAGTALLWLLVLSAVLRVPEHRGAWSPVCWEGKPANPFGVGDNTGA